MLTRLGMKKEEIDKVIEYIRGTTKKDVPKTGIRRNIKSFQRSNKGKVRYYTHESEVMRRATEMESKRRESVTVFEKFMGSKEDDFKSGYDENALGSNKRFETPVLKEEYAVMLQEYSLDGEVEIFKLKHSSDKSATLYKPETNDYINMQVYEIFKEKFQKNYNERIKFKE